MRRIPFLVAAVLVTIIYACTDRTGSGPMDLDMSDGGGSSSGTSSSGSSSGEGDSGNDGSSSSGTIDDGGDASMMSDASDSGDSGDGGPADSGGDAGPFVLTSTSFVDGAAIPLTYTCDNTGGTDPPSPPLAWSGAPAAAMAFALEMRDTTVGTGGNYHWVIYDIGKIGSLPEGVPHGATLTTPVSAKQTLSSYTNTFDGYFPPCPPSGAAAHHYEFTLYAVDTSTLGPITPTDPDSVDISISAHMIASTRLVGTYSR
jgi:Raf kinase inhibitor-like YbhB/YbcL family protein